MIITIIVMMILAAVVISLVVSEKGIITKVEQSSEKMEIDGIFEQVVGMSEYNLSGKVNVKATYGNVKEFYGNKVELLEPSDENEITETTTSVKIKITGKYDEYEFMITEDGIKKLELSNIPNDAITLEDILGTYTELGNDTIIKLNADGTYNIDDEVGEYSYNPNTKIINNITMGVEGPVNIINGNKTFAMYMGEDNVVIFTSNGNTGLLSNELLNIEFKYEDENSDIVKILKFSLNGEATLTEIYNSGESISIETDSYCMFSRISEGTTEGTDTKISFDEEIFVINRDFIGNIISLTNSEDEIFINNNYDPISAIDRYKTLQELKVAIGSSDDLYIELKEENKVKVSIDETLAVGTYQINGTEITFDVKDEKGEKFDIFDKPESVEYYEIGSGENKNVVVAMIDADEKGILTTMLFTSNGLKGLEATELQGKTILADLTLYDDNITSITFNDNNKCVDNIGNEYCYYSLKGIHGYDENYIMLNIFKCKIEKNSEGNTIIKHAN